MPKMIEFYSVPEAAKLLGCDIEAVDTMRARKQFHSAIQDEGEWLIPMRDLEAVMCRVKILEFADLSPKKARDAIRKWSKIQRYYSLLQKSGYYSHCSGGKRLRGEAAGTIGVPVNTVQRWQHRIRLKGIRGLVDGRGGDHKYRSVI